MRMPSTTRSSDCDETECHVLNFFYDDDNGCAVTVFLNGVRFHIIADADRLKGDSSAAREIETKYRSLMSAMRNEAERDENGEEGKIEKRNELDAAEMHDPGEEAGDSQDSGFGGNSDNETPRKVDDDNDSAVDVSEENRELKEIGVRNNGIVLGQHYAPESEKTLQSWMLSPFNTIFDKLAHPSKAPTNQTLQEWYNGLTYFYTLDIKDDKLVPSEEEATEELKKRLIELTPRMPLPKYIKNLDIPLVQAKDIIVLEEGAEPEPYHPIRVKVKEDTYFLKMVDMTQYQPTKREIKLLKDIEKKGLHQKIRVPKITGLVYENSKSEIMGFLQTDIEEPTPLTKMLDSDVVEDNRKKWADETQRIMKFLHDSDIIWGDAKADNFMVDKHGELWIIDFGGSYTEGWVDPELMETEEGDNMGTEKIVNALEDPESNTYEPEDYEDDGHLKYDSPPKRKRLREDYNDDERSSSPKRRR